MLWTLNTGEVEVVASGSGEKDGGGLPPEEGLFKTKYHKCS